MAESVFVVEGITCDHCKMSVTRAVKGLSGVSDVAVDLRAKRVTVIHDGSVSHEAVKGAIEKAGYRVVN